MIVHKILISGANGMLGSSLCSLFAGQHSVIALHRDDKCYSEVDQDYSVDILDHEKITDIVNKTSPTIIIHCAGLVNVEECEKQHELAYAINVTATKNLVDVCPADAVFIYISTDQVYGELQDHAEYHNNLEQLNQYGRTKYLGEREVIRGCPGHIVIRTNTFGWNVKSGRISFAEWVYYSLHERKGITLFHDYLFSPVYDKTLGKIVLDLVNTGFQGIINVGSSDPCSKYDFGIELARVCGFDMRLINRGSIIKHTFSARRSSDLSLDVTKLNSVGLTAPDWKSSIREFVEDHIQKIY